MKKFLTLITCFILLLVPAFSAYDRNVALIKIEDNKNRINTVFSLLPYDGASNVNMRTENYPSRVDGASLTWASHNSNEPDYVAMEAITNTSNNGRYRDEHMIAMGGVEMELPGAIANWYEIDAGWQGQDWRYEYHDCYRVLRSIDKESSQLYLSVDCPSDFEFVSQSDSSYRRPFELFYIPKSTSSGTDGRGYGYKIDRSINRKPLKYDPEEQGGSKPGIWFDMMLALPYDNGGYNDVGVIVDDTLYPLQDASDYTSMVTITLSSVFKVRYEIYYIDEVRQTSWDWGEYDNDNNEWEYKETIEYPIEYTGTVTIPFYGYCSSFSSVPKDDVGSLYIATTPESQNINLNPGATLGRVKVADISYLFNDGHIHTSATAPEYDPSLAWIFLSASPDPYDSNENGFRLINDKAGNVLTSNNNVPFIVEVQGINKSRDNAAGEGAGGFVEFDGKAQRSSFPDELPSGSAGEINFIHTSCEYGRNLPHVSAEQHYHYHSFEGEVYVQLRPNSSTEPLMAGRYTGDIYVHVISEDGTEG